jgi:hypothetical protein
MQRAPRERGMNRVNPQLPGMENGEPRIGKAALIASVGGERGYADREEASAAQGTPLDRGV